MVKVPDQSSWTTCSVVATRPRGGSRGFKGVEPLGNSVQVPYTSCYHCEDEVREGSVQSNHSELTSKTSTHLAFSALKWFEGVEPLGNSVQVPYTPCYHCEDEIREGSVQSNHSELTSKTSTHLAFSALKWFEKVRGGSRGLNHSETVYRYPTHLVTTVKMRFEKVRYSRTTPNSRQRLLHTLLSLH